MKKWMFLAGVFLVSPAMACDSAQSSDKYLLQITDKMSRICLSQGICSDSYEVLKRLSKESRLGCNKTKEKEYEFDFLSEETVKVMPQDDGGTYKKSSGMSFLTQTYTDW